MRTTDIPGSKHLYLLSTWPAMIGFSLGVTWLVVMYVPRLLTFIWSV